MKKTVQLPQVKLFWTNSYETMKDAEIEVNKHIIECYERDGNYPSQIIPNSKYITVVTSKLIEFEVKEK